MSESIFEELVGIFTKKGLAGVMEVQGAKVAMYPTHQRSSRKKVPREPQPQKK